MTHTSTLAGRRADWDAIVVGGGLGGLTCAAYLAATGRRVLVLEQFEVVGGNSHVFRRRRRYEFDVGVHYLGDCGDGGLIPAIMGGVGLADRIQFLPMDQDGFDQIRVPGAEVDMPAGWPRYRERLCAALPKDAGGIGTFVDICAAIGREQRNNLLATRRPTPAELLAGTEMIRRWGRRTLDELFAHCGLSTRARAVLAAQAPNYGLTPKQATVSRHTSVTDHYLRGAYYPAGGGQVLPAGLAEVISANGGQLRTGARVRRILVEDNRVTGVRLDDETITADLVVSNADYRRTVLDLVGAEHFTAPVVARTRDAVMGMPWFVLYLGLDTDLSERANANLWWYDVEDIDGYFQQARRGELTDVPFLFCSFASLKDPANRALCPAGQANVELMTLCPSDPDWWGVSGGPADGVPYRRNPRYQERKRQLTEAALRAAERAIGPLRKHTVHLEAATPLTQERYTLSTGGTPMGMAEWGGTARPGTATSVRGLHVVGASTQAGNGIAGVMLSGIACAGEILGQNLLALAHQGAVFADPARLPDRPSNWDPRRACEFGVPGVRRRRNAAAMAGAPN